MLRRTLLDRRVWLVAAVLILVVILSRVVLSPETGFSWVIHGGYWFVLASVGLFLGPLIPLVRAQWAKWKFERFDAAVLLSILGGDWLHRLVERPPPSVMRWLGWVTAFMASVGLTMAFVIRP